MVLSPVYSVSPTKFFGVPSSPPPIGGAGATCDYEAPLEEEGLFSSKGTKPRPELSTEPVFIIHDLEIDERRAAKKTVKVWREYVYERLGKSRIAVAGAPGDEALKVKLEDDRLTVKNYTMVADLAADSITKPTHTIRIVSDTSSSQVQGIGSFSVADKEMEVQDLLTAPWNLPMHADNEESHKPLAVRGAGTVLMHSFYTTAQEMELSELGLKPSSDAVPYYSKIGMVWDEKRMRFCYPVEKDRVPTKLQAVLERSLVALTGKE